MYANILPICINDLVVATADTSLYVSLTTLNQKDLPNIYASLGQLPTKGNADISNCNQNWCNLVKTISVDSSLAIGDDMTENWYLGIFLPTVEDSGSTVTDSLGSLVSLQIANTASFLSEATGLDTPKRSKNITYGVWYNSTCVPGCTINQRGTCMDTGLCVCYVDYTGIDCGICVYYGETLAYPLS